MTEVPRPAGEVNPQLSPYFEEVLKTLLAKERELRFATADDLRVVLEEGEKSAWWRDRAVRVRAETRRPLRRIRIPRETALYGRDAEIARLRVLFEKAKAGEGQVVVVEGEAGIGKSRLVDEFVGLLQREGEDVHFLFGSYPPGGAATASGAFTTAYREHFGEETLEDALREALPQTPLLVPAFAALLRGDGAPAGAEPLTKDSIQTVFVHATRSLAGGRPTIVLIDDLHFAPEEGRGLFASLALAVPGHRILLVGTARPGLPENWLVNVERVGHVARMPLPRLGPKDLVRLLVDAFRSERLAEELSFKIAAKSDGNPFFVFEILRGLKEGQFLTQKADGTWATTQILRDIQVPSSIQDLVQARVADLDDDDRNLLDVASCCGFEFDPLLAGAVLRMERIPLLQRLAKIEKRHRLVRSAGARFVFDHHQVQEALYGGLPDLLRTEYHAAIGAALEARENTATRDPATLDGALYVDLAEHFLKGAHGTRALRYLDSALTHLERNYLNDAAVRLADRALGMPGLLTGTERARTLLRQCGSACPLDRLGRRVRQEAAAREAEHVAEAAGDEDLRGQAARALGCLLVQTARNAEAEASYRQALEIARARGDRRAECDAELGLGNVSRSLCDTRKHYERARAIAGDAGIRSGEAFATGNLGVVATWEGRFAVARNHHERALAIHSEMGNRRGEALAIGGLGIVCLEEGHLANAMEFFERRLAICREIGDRPGQAGVTVNLGIVFESRGCLTEAREYLERGIVICREVGHREFEANATTSLGEDLRIQGRLAEAREHHEQAIAIYREIGNRQDLASALHNLGCTHSESSDFASAEERLGESLSISEEIGDGRRSAKTHLALGSLRVARGDVVRGRESFARALEEASKSGFAQVETLARCHLAGHPGGDPHDAERVFASNEERLGAAERQEARFLLWQATRDPVHLAEAKRRLDFLVEHAPPDCRESMLTNVRLHREIAAAAREAGL